MRTHTQRLLGVLIVLAAVIVAAAPSLALAATSTGQVALLPAVQSVKAVELGSRGATLAVDVQGKTHSVAVDFASFLPSGMIGDAATGGQGSAVTGAITLAVIVFVFGWLRRMASVFVRVGHRPMR